MGVQISTSIAIILMQVPSTWVSIVYALCYTGYKETGKLYNLFNWFVTLQKSIYLFICNTVLYVFVNQIWNISAPVHMCIGTLTFEI